MNKPSHEDIALVAYNMWQNMGKPENADVWIWLSAEETLMNFWRKHGDASE